MRTYLAASIMGADFKNLGASIKSVVEAGVDYIHIDVMDGMFVPNISFGQPVIRSIRPLTDKQFDVQLMTQQPERYISAAIDSGADILTVHVETCTHLHKAVRQIREKGCRPGVVICPATPLESIRYILEDIDLVVLMACDPGWGPQQYIRSMTRKIKDLRKMAGMTGKDIDIEVEGGITLDNVSEVVGAGANIIVASAAIFQGDPAENVRSFKEKMREIHAGHFV